MNVKWSFVIINLIKKSFYSQLVSIGFCMTFQYQASTLKSIGSSFDFYRILSDIFSRVVFARPIFRTYTYFISHAKRMAGEGERRGVTKPPTQIGCPLKLYKKIDWLKTRELFFLIHLQLKFFLFINTIHFAIVYWLLILIALWDVEKIFLIYAKKPTFWIAKFYLITGWKNVYKHMLKIEH